MSGELDKRDEVVVRRLPVYPFLAAIFPILSILSSNAPIVSPGEAVFPSLIMAGITAITWLCLWPFLRDRHKGAFAVLYVLVLFWAYGPVLDGVRTVFQYRDMLSARQALPIVLAGAASLVLLVVFVRRSARNWAGATQFLNAFALLAVSVSLIGLWMGHRGDSGDGATALGELAPVSIPENAERPPDIIYIIADAYGRHDVLLEEYGYDNIAFVEALEERGFYVARESRSNYNYTRFSIPSSLNFQYTNGISTELGGDTSSTQLIRENRLVPYLREHGYETVSFETGYTETEDIGADRYLKPPVSISEFQNVLINATPLRSIVSRLHAYKEDKLGQRYSQYDLHRERVIFTLDELKALKPDERPRFTFAHMVFPHWPFVFDENLNPTYPTIRFSLKAEFRSWEAPTKEEFRTGYVKQLQAFNKLMLPTLDTLLENNPNAVVILQADHGPRERSIDNAPRDWATYQGEEFPILNAYRFPDDRHEQALYPTITPVNSFRIVLNQYLDAKLELLEDYSYFYDHANATLHPALGAPEHPGDS